MPKSLKTIAIALLCLSLLSACATETKSQKGGLIGAGAGAAAGALIGQLIGRDTKATLIGAAIGAAIGGGGGAAVGHMMDKQEQDMRQALANSNAAAVRREGDLLAISLKGDVTFDFDSAVVRPGLYSEIDRIANILNKYPDTVISVEGYTDSTGSEEYNMKLSGRRAEAVKNLLVQRGVSPSRIQTVAFGEANPVASNDTDYGRAMNRRVEIKVAPSQYGQG
jgi:outer membrane protein OmpA-like peptidoglycan-associated protein